jgi:hypothetical protein
MQSMQPICDIKPIVDAIGPAWLPEVKGVKKYLPLATQQVVTQFLQPKIKGGNEKKKK